jgi:cobalt-zinc-cadmium resistance protein CzcA
VQAAIGGAPISQVIQGDRRFDLTVRYPEANRSSPEAIRAILLPTADGSGVPLGQVADVSIHEGSFMIYREGGRRYIPIKFSVRGRDLATTINELQDKLAKEVPLPNGYTESWAGEFDSLRKEQKRLALIIPISLAIIVILLYMQFGTWKDALIVLATLPFAAVGGTVSLFLWHTPFSISAAVGFTSLIGVATLGCVVFMSGVRRAQRESIEGAGLEHGCVDEMRPVVMACMAAGLGLLPAALSTGIGAQAQQPLARVVVGGMLTTILAILFVLPLLLRQHPPRLVHGHETE